MARASTGRLKGSCLVLARSLQPALDNSAARTLSFIREFCHRERLRPTLRDVAGGLGQPEPLVGSLVQALCNLGMLERMKSARGVVFVILDLEHAKERGATR